jgi:hypothetical protein
MSVKSYNEPVPKAKMSQFDEILKASGGRYIGNPQESHDCFRVNYEYDPEKGFDQRWDRVNRDVVEVRKDQWWRILGRRLLGLVRRTT